jgi:hypothetical protein
MAAHAAYLTPTQAVAMFHALHANPSGPFGASSSPLDSSNTNLCPLEKAEAWVKSRVESQTAYDVSIMSKVNRNRLVDGVGSQSEKRVKMAEGTYMTSGVSIQPQRALAVDLVANQQGFAWHIKLHAESPNPVLRARVADLVAFSTKVFSYFDDASVTCKYLKRFHHRHAKHDNWSLLFDTEPTLMIEACMESMKADTKAALVPKARSRADPTAARKPGPAPRPGRTGTDVKICDSRIDTKLMECQFGPGCRFRHGRCLSCQKDHSAGTCLAAGTWNPDKTSVATAIRAMEKRRAGAAPRRARQ